MILKLNTDRYNQLFISDAKKLGGVWDSTEKTWVFQNFVDKEVEKLKELYTFEMIAVRASAKTEIISARSAITLFGYTIARAFDRDSGAKTGAEVAQLAGEVRSGGSKKNWTTEATSDSVFVLKVPKLLFDKHKNKYKNWNFEVI